MMCDVLLVLLLCNFTLIGLLPVCFFRRDGRFNLRWTVTSLPFFIAPALLILGRIDVFPATPLSMNAPRAVAALLAVPLSVASNVLLAMTAGAHRVPPALWHQDNDAPLHLVTWGPYARIRHPFYTSFLLAFAATVFAQPHVSTLACMLYAWVALTFTAKREERRLEASGFGAEYRAYRSVSGRFLPRFLP